jgi:hypothetical protein
MDDTTRYDRQFAAEFFEGTVGVDMSPSRERFSAWLAAGARIFDTGCGSSRDAKALARPGKASAFRLLTPLLNWLRALAHCRFAVHVRTFSDVDAVNAYDGIWCCASVLQVAPTEVQGVLARL